MRKSADSSSFGALLRELRLAAQLSQDGLAERAAMSADGISALERGVNKAPQRETLALLVNALRLEPHQRQALETAARKASGPRRVEPHAAKKHNLPRLASPLFGRESDLAEVSALLARAPVLTLTGAGGVGKTRLAIELAHRAAADFAGGSWFIDLAAVRDSAAVPWAVAGVFGVREDPGRPLIDTIVETLKRKKLVLIFDNCEHIVAGCAAAVEKIAAECPEARVLATSRQPLAIAGEQTFRLASLSVDASVALFSETARRADASFSLDGDLPTVERICSRLDGIALAIELAAARVRLLSVAQIEELLSQRFAVLTGSGRLARHKTMRALVDWSYDLLSTEEQLFFARAGVFPAEFSFEAALEICSGDGITQSHVLEILGSLVDKSLLTSERRGKARRFRLLETMRAYALEKLGTAIHERSARHAQYYLKLAESGDSRRPELQDVFEAEYDNLRCALDWAIDERGDAALGIRLLWAMREFVLYRGLGADSARRAERALNGRPYLPKALQAMAWETIAAMRGDLLMPAEALEATSQALTLYEELEDYGGVARGLRRRGVAYLRLGNFTQAQDDLYRSLELGKRYDDPLGVARTLGSIAVSFEMMGRPLEGRTAMLEALDMAKREGDGRLIGVTLINLAETEFASGDTESSVGRLEELLATRASRKNARLRANAKANLSVYLLALHREAEARATARTAMHDAREAGDDGIVACAIQHLAAMISRTDARTAAKLLGYVDSVFAGGYRRENTEQYTHALLLTALQEKLNEADIAGLTREGAAMTELQATRLATRG
jgi:predicted ATPase